MKKTVDEINKMIMEDAPMEEINDAIGYIDIYSCFDPIFEPPIDFLEECRKHWETAQSSFRKTIERKIGNTWYVIETECDGNEPLADKVKNTASTMARYLIFIGMMYMKSTCMSGYRTANEKNMDR